MRGIISRAAGIVSTVITPTISSGLVSSVETTGANPSVETDADASGATTAIIFGDTRATELYSYNTLGALRSAQFPSGPTLTFGYDALGRRQSVTRMNSTRGTIPFSTSYGYDDASALQLIADTIPNNANTRSFQTDPAGGIASRTISNPTTWSYQSAPPAAKTYAADLLDRYASAAGVGPTYDTNGNLTGGDGTGNSYIYDSLNHLVSANTGGITFTLRYDALGRPYSMSGSNGLVRQWAWAGSRLVRETRNGAATNILPGQGTETLAVGTSFAVNDERGSVVALAHGVSGNVTGVVYRCDTFW